MSLHKRLLPTLSLGLALVGAAYAQPASTASIGGSTFVNHGLVGVGRLTSTAKDKYGETIGSFSAFTFDAKSWRRNANGSYSGTLYMQPDRGYNNPTAPLNWRARFFTLAVTFAPTLTWRLHSKPSRV